MKIAIYSRGGENFNYDDLLLLLEELEKQNISFAIYHDFLVQIKHLVSADKHISFKGAEDLDDSFECILSMGGDGTLLDTVTLVRNTNIPVLGINFGRLGFLATIGKDELRNAVSCLAERTYLIDRRSLIHLDASIPLFADSWFK